MELKLDNRVVLFSTLVDVFINDLLRKSLRALIANKKTDDKIRLQIESFKSLPKTKSFYLFHLTHRHLGSEQLYYLGKYVQTIFLRLSSLGRLSSPSSSVQPFWPWQLWPWALPPSAWCCLHDLAAPLQWLRERFSLQPF